MNVLKIRRKQLAGCKVFDVFITRSKHQDHRFGGVRDGHGKVVEHQGVTPMIPSHTDEFAQMQMSSLESKVDRLVVPGYPNVSDGDGSFFRLAGGC